MHLRRHATFFLMLAYPVAMVSAMAHAHAYLDHASPRVGSVVNSSPSEVRLSFTQALEPRFTAAQLRSSAGAVVATGGVDPGNPKEIVIRVRALAPGRYKVNWKVLSVDTHRTEGSFGFEVKP
jgi:methionine-rich copper-binding protein CopC